MHRIACLSVVAVLFVVQAGTGAQPKPELRQLRADLRSGDDKVKLAAVQSLADLGAEAAPALPELIETLQAPSEDLRLNSALALSKIGKPAVPVLAKLLAGPERSTRYYALSALAWIGPDAHETSGAVAKALADGDAGVRCKAAFALGRFAPAAGTTVPLLIGAFDDENKDVRETAAEAAGRFGAAAAPALIAALKEKKAPRSIHAARALAAIGPAASDAVPTVQAWLHSGEPTWRNEACATLVAIGPTARPALVAAARTGPSESRAAAVRALGQMGAPAAPDLLELLTCKHSDTRRAAALAITPFKAGDQAVVEALAQRLEDDDEFVRLYCAKALHEIGSAAKLAAPQLRAALLDINYQVRWTAFQTLHEIGADPRPWLREKAKAKVTRTRIITNALFFEIRSKIEKSDDEYDYAVLKAGLAEKDLDLRMQAAYALHQFHGEHVRPTTPIFVEGLRSKSPGVRAQAIDGLRMNASFRHQDDAAAPILVDMYWNDPEPTLKKEAHVALVNVRFDAKTMIPAVTKMLRHENAEVRMDGVNIVHEYGVAAIPLLTERFEDPNPRVRKVACSSLRYMAQTGANLKPALDQLRALTRHKDAEVRESVLWLLGPMGEATWSDLLSCLKDADAEVRDRALHQLREQRGAPNIPTKRLTVALADLLKNHADARVRLFAVASLDGRDPDAFAPLLEAARNDKDEDVRVGALCRLGAFKAQAKPALPLLIGALKNPSATIRRNVALALSDMGPAAAAAIPNLIDALQDKDEEVRKSAAWALSHLGNETIAPVFKLLDKGSSPTRTWALLVLRNHKYHDKKGLPVLIACLKDADDNVRWQTCLILEGMGADAREAAGALRGLLHERFWVSDAARDALKAIGEPVKENRK